MDNYRVGVVGLGYVGLPLAVEFGKHFATVGFDISENRVLELQNNLDRTGEMQSEDLKSSPVLYTTDPLLLRDCNFIIIAVPTPIDSSKKPDVSFLEQASAVVGRNLSKGTIVVYESTVYPGCTEEVCVPILESTSGMVAGEEFFIGYSPERINPGDNAHSLESIVKVVAAGDMQTLQKVNDVYATVVKAGLFPVSCIKVAEAAKVIENTQRDLNVALMNELALIFDKMGIDTEEVLSAARTKWNFIDFKPGLVGGHCIGVDPYYLTHKATLLGYHPEVILAGRKINDGMGKFIATSFVKQLIRNGTNVVGATAVVLGVTFKENVRDLRNSKVIDIIQELEEFGIDVRIVDPMADPRDALKRHGINIVRLSDVMHSADGVILAVPHRDFLESGWDGIIPLLKTGNGVVMDVKSVLPRMYQKSNFIHWRL